MCCSSHYHAVRVLGASAYDGAEILASDATRELIVERGQQDKDSEIGRFPRLFRAVESISGLTWPTITFPKQMSVWLGKREVRIMHIGRGHTAGDVIAYVPDANVVFSGDLVEYHSACDRESDRAGQAAVGVRGVHDHRVRVNAVVGAELAQLLAPFARGPFIQQRIQRAVMDGEGVEAEQA